MFSQDVNRINLFETYLRPGPNYLKIISNEDTATTPDCGWNAEHIFQYSKGNVLRLSEYYFTLGLVNALLALNNFISICIISELIINICGLICGLVCDVVCLKTAVQ